MPAFEKAIVAQTKFCLRARQTVISQSSTLTFGIEYLETLITIPFLGLGHIFLYRYIFAVGRYFVHLDTNQYPQH